MINKPGLVVKSLVYSRRMDETLHPKILAVYCSVKITNQVSSRHRDSDLGPSIRCHLSGLICMNQGRGDVFLNLSFPGISLFLFWNGLVFGRKNLSEPMHSHEISFDSLLCWECLPINLPYLDESKGLNKHDNFKIIIFILNSISGYNLEEHVQDSVLMESFSFPIKMFLGWYLLT